MLNISIVLYKTKPKEISQLLDTLKATKLVRKIYLIDNSPTSSAGFSTPAVDYIFTGKNLGYGTAHNIAIRKTIEQNVPYHLVVNPDITFSADSLEKMIQYMKQNTDIGHLMPKVYYPNGNIQYLCKLIPTPFDLIFRRFLPRNWTKKRTDKFELRASGYNRTMNVPYLSGCFMLLRTDALKVTGLFDERFFMYPEDIDLTRRIHQRFRTVFYPEVSITHHHAQSSYINIGMLLVHITNMIKYFNKWGWFFDKERKKTNRKTIESLKL